jgi:hypothetical protein
MSQPQLVKKETSSNSVPPSVSVSTVSGSEPDLEVQVYDWEESQKDPSVGSDDWTEAKKKGGKKEKDKSGPGERKERGGRRGLAGTAAAANGNGSGRERKTKRGSKGKKDFGVRDMKPRPCHSYYLSKFFLCLCCTRYNLIGEEGKSSADIQVLRDVETMIVTTDTNSVCPPPALAHTRLFSAAPGNWRS